MSGGDVQLDLFTYMQEAPTADPLGRDSNERPLNGCYYEKSTDLFVSYVMGRRHWESDGQGEPAEWKKKTKAEREI